MLDRLAIGNQGEKKAERYLKKHGLHILLRNFRCSGGELDIVAEDSADNSNTLIVIEVRQRKNDHFGNAAESVDNRKQQRIILATQVLLQKHPKWQSRPVRFDVIGITGSKMEWITHAFEA